MTYSLYLHFEPRLRRKQMFAYFASRKHYKLVKNRMSYENEDTGVYFWLTLQSARDTLLRPTVASAEFEINYNRPSFFRIEAEKELSSLVTAFQPRIEDPQIKGMGEGPYSAEGFFSGWNFGNAFSVRDGLTRSPDRDVASMPGDALRAAWLWNYHCADQRKKLDHRCFVPAIRFFRIKGRPCSVVTWGEGMPIMLPRVDYVLVGRFVSGDRRVGLVSWSEVVDVASRAGFDASKEPLELVYLVPPPAIATWVKDIPLIDFDTMQRVYPYQIVDDELIAAAREGIERDRAHLDDASTLE